MSALYRIRPTWLGGIRLERHVDWHEVDDANLVPGWRRVEPDDVPKGAFELIPQAEAKALHARVAKAEKNAKAQRGRRQAKAADAYAIAKAGER